MLLHVLDDGVCREISSKVPHNLLGLSQDAFVEEVAQELAYLFALGVGTHHGFDERSYLRVLLPVVCLN